MNGRCRSGSGLADKCWISQINWRPRVPLGSTAGSAASREKRVKEEEEAGGREARRLERAAERAFERRKRAALQCVTCAAHHALIFLLRNSRRACSPSIVPCAPPALIGSEGKALKWEENTFHEASCLLELKRHQIEERGRK